MNSSSSSDYQLNLDIIRVVLAFMVMTVHVGITTQLYTDIDSNILALFFVISGYFAIKSYDRNPNVKNYYKRRLIKILPTYYICLAILYIEDWCICYAQTHTLRRAFREQCSYKFLRYVFFIQSIIPDNDYWKWCDHGALWTMSTFGVFYLLVPLIHKLCKNFWRSMALLALLVIVNPYLIQGISNLISGYSDVTRTYFPSQFPLAKIYIFMFGITLYWAMKEKKEHIYIMLLAIILFATGFKWLQYEIYSTILLFTATILPPVTKSVKAVSIIRYLSGISFALYLIHPTIIAAVNEFVTSKGISINQYFYALILYISSFAATVLVDKLLIQPITAKIIKKKST